MIRIPRTIPRPWSDALAGLYDALVRTRRVTDRVDVPHDDPFGLDALDRGEVDVTVAPRDEVEWVHTGIAPYARAYPDVRALCRITQPHFMLIAATASGPRTFEELRARSWSALVDVDPLSIDRRLLPRVLDACGTQLHDRIDARDFERAIASREVQLAIGGLRPDWTGPFAAIWPRGAELGLHAVPVERTREVATGTLAAGTLPWIDRDVAAYRWSDHLVVGHAGLTRDDAYEIVRALDEHPQLLSAGASGFGLHSPTMWRETGVPLHVGAMQYVRERGYLR